RVMSVGSGTGYLTGRGVPIGLAARRWLVNLVRVEALRPSGSLVELDTGQVGAVEAGFPEVCAAEIRCLEVGALEVGVVEFGVDQSGAFEAGLPQVACLQVRVVELCFLQPRAGKVGVPADDSTQVAAGEAGDPQVREGQVERAFLIRMGSVPEDVQSHLNVFGSQAQPEHAVVECRRVVLMGWLRWRRPGRAGPDECSEDPGDGLPVLVGVLGEAFERVEAADAYVDVVACHLVDGSGHAVGDLAVAADLNLPPGGYGASDQDETGEAVQQGRAGDVLQLGLRLLSSDER